ncbi:MAG: MFS transporter [Anaerolineae bacterium]|nr:MFS transporter [Anaerolineae bacterium]
MSAPNVNNTTQTRGTSSGSAVSTGHRWYVLALVLVPVFIGALDLTIVSAILPEILTKLSIPVDTNLGAAAWAVTGYLLAYIVSMIITGRVSDLIGRRAVYLACLAIFIFGSYWVATAHELPTQVLNLIARRYLGQRPDLNQLTLIAVIIGRVIQALGAGAMVPVSMALVGDLFPPERRSQPVGLIGAVDTLGWVLGHLYGGVMVNFFNQRGGEIAAWLQSIGLNLPPPDWHTLFYLNVPIGLIAFVLTWLALRGVKSPSGVGRFDVVGAVMVSLSLILLNLGLGGSAEISTTRTLDEATGTQINLPLLAIAGVCFVAFLIYEWRIKYPLLELHLFRKRNISAASLTNLLIGFCLMLGLVSVPLLVNLRAEDASAEAISRAAERAGILLSALTIPMAAAAIPGGWLSAKRGYRLPTVLGLILATAGFVMAGTTWRADTPDLTMALHMLVVGIGLGLTISPIGTAVINEVDEHARGVASALVLILRLLGMTIAVSSLTTFALTRVSYLVQLASENFPVAVTAEDLQRLSVQAYFEAGIQVIGEMLLIGAVVSAIAIVPALWLHNRNAEVTNEA